MKKVSDYAKNRVQALVNALEKYHQFQEPDSLHRIRVEIKKLKSVMMVLGYADKKFDAHARYRPLRSIFRKAGKVREPVVLMELMRHYGIEGMPAERLQAMQKTAERFRGNTPFYMTEVKKLAKKMQPRLSRVRRKDVSGYVKELEKFIRGTFLPRTNTSRLHTARKRMKQAVYLADLSDRLTKEDKKFYTKMQALLGALHDKEVLLEFLVRMPRGKATATRMLLRKQIQSDRKVLTQELTKFYRR